MSYSRIALHIEFHCIAYYTALHAIHGCIACFTGVLHTSCHLTQLPWVHWVYCFTLVRALRWLHYIYAGGCTALNTLSALGALYTGALH